MKKLPTAALAILIGFASLAKANLVELQVGEPFVEARVRLYVAGWRADPRSHASSGDYMGLDRQLVQNGYSEVDYCSVGKSFCTLQYIKGKACLRVHTQGEEMSSMKVESWSLDCRERGENEPAKLPPADVRYLAQWIGDCKNFGQCRGIGTYVRELKKKYAGDREMTAIIDDYKAQVEAEPNRPGP